MKRGIIMNQENNGKFIAECRKEKNMTQQELAEKIGVTDRENLYIKHYENVYKYIITLLNNVNKL